MLNQETAKAARTDSGYILRAPRRMRVADAVAQYMRVPMGAGNSVPWDPLVAPYVIEPMNCLASREYDAVIFVGPARTGKTIGLIDGWVIYNVICDPADMLIIQMTEEKAREHSKKRLARTFRVSPEVVSRLSPNKNDNNVYDRTFLAGNYLKIGWPSVNIMSSSDYKCVALTDYDRFPEDIDGEGDAFSLASKRTTTFMSSGMTLVESSPGRDVKDVKWRRTSPHEAPPTTGILSLYNRGDRRRWYWPCPHCGEYFQPCGDVVAGFRDIADPVLASEAAYIQCPSCSGRILPEQKRELNGRGVWLRDGESINADGSRYGDPRRSRIASFWMEGPAAAYQTLSQLVYKLLTAEQEYETTGSEETLKTVINTDWGLPYLPRASMEQRKSELLEQRAEPVPSRSVPDGVNFLVATVDVQAGRHRRFVVQVTGYGSRGERWIIDRYNITQSLRGDSDGESQRIDPASYPEDWDVLLTDVFHKSWPLASDPSQQMRLMAMAVDSGGEDGVTDNAYKFWRRCRRDGLGKRIYLFKGDSIRRAKLISRTFPDNTGRTGRRAQAAGDVPLWLLQTDALKDRVNNALWRDSPGPGYVHFPDWLGSWFYDELTYEERSSDGKWSKPGRGANEAFDLMVYAEALVILHGYEKTTRTHKARRENRTADQLSQYGAVSLREQARYLDNNHDLVIGVFDKLEERVVGKNGIIVEPHPVLRNGAIARDLAAEIRTRWSEWSVSPEVTGQFTRPMLERLMLRTWLRDGEVFAQMVSGRINSLTPSAGVHFWLEALEPDFIPMTSDESNRLNQGVFVDDWGRPEKYLVYKSRPVSGRQMETKEVDAERMLHLKFVRRLHQMRGTSLLSGVLIRLSALKEYEDSELTAARIAAALGMYIRKGDGQSYEPDGNGSKENERELTIQPGIIYDDLKPGEEIGMVKSDRPNPNLETFRNGQLRAVAAGSRLSFSSTARNYNGTYSAQRQELVESTDGYLILQDWFIGAVTRPMYRAWLKQAVASGVIRLPRDLDRSSLYTAVYSGPVMPWIDPVKEAEAWKIQIRGGAATESDWVRAGGRNPDDVKRRRKAEIDENRKLDLVFDTDPASDKGGSSAATKRQEPQHTDDQSEE